jgi:hypothetical protein
MPASGANQKKTSHMLPRLMRAAIIFYAIVAWVSVTACVRGADEPAGSRFPDANMAPIPDWTGPVFHLSQWQKVDFRTDFQKASGFLGCL